MTAFGCALLLMSYVDMLRAFNLIREYSKDADIEEFLTVAPLDKVLLVRSLSLNGWFLLQAATVAFTLATRTL